MDMGWTHVWAELGWVRFVKNCFLKKNRTLRVLLILGVSGLSVKPVFTKAQIAGFRFLTHVRVWF